MVDAMEKGEKATWPELDRIQRRTAVEQAIDRSIRDARERVHFSDSQVNLRLSAMRKQSTAEKFQQRGRRRRSSAGISQRATESMILTGSQPLAPSFQLHLAGDRSPRSSSEDGTHLSRSPSLIPDFTSSSPQFSDTDESEADDLQQPRFRKNNTWPDRPALGVPNWPYGSMSQPVTPSIASKAFNFSASPSPRPSSPILTHAATFAMTPASPAQSTTSSIHGAPPALPARRPSSPEAMYKRIFHPTKNAEMRAARATSPEEATASTPEAEAAAGGGAEDGRKQRFSLLARRKRSTSTGLKGLKPPGRGAAADCGGLAGRLLMPGGGGYDMMNKRCREQNTGGTAACS